MFVGCRARFLQALTMSSRSFVAAKMHVLVSMARALLLGRILRQLGYDRVAYGALNVESQYS